MPDNELLLIEDCAPERKHCAALLSRAGFSVTAVASAQAALELIQERGAKSPPVLLVDWELPKMNGMQLVMLLRGMEFRLRPYIMMLTSRAQTGSVVAALNRGADDYVTKPIIESELISRLRVADRTVTIQRKLVERAEVAEEKLNQALARERALTVSAAAGSAPPLSITTKTAAPEDLVLQAARQILGKLHLPVESQRAVVLPDPDGLVAWTGLAVPKWSRWLDICVVAAPEVAEAMVARVVREDVVSDAADWLSEFAHLVRSQVRKDLMSRELESIPSATQRSYRGWPQSLLDTAGRVAIQQFELQLDCGRLLLSIGISETTPKRVRVGDLAPGLFVSESIQAAKHPGLTLAKVGTVVTRQLIETLRKADVCNDFSVLEVSPFARNALAVA